VLIVEFLSFIFVTVVDNHIIYLMQASVELINQRIKNAPQEVLNQLLGYLDTLIDEYPDEIPKWQKR
jgi:hypothetical protein